jgi:hypothetical protein
MRYTAQTDEPMEVPMDLKQSIELAVFVISAIALIASFFNMLTRERSAGIGYIYNGSGGGDGRRGSSNSTSDPCPSSVSHGGHGCSGGGSSSDGGSCSGGDGGGGGGGD